MKKYKLFSICRPLSGNEIYLIVQVVAVRMLGKNVGTGTRVSPSWWANLIWVVSCGSSSDLR